MTTSERSSAPSTEASHHDTPCRDVFSLPLEQIEEARCGEDAETLERHRRRTVLLGLANAAERFGLLELARDLGVLVDHDFTGCLTRMAEAARAWILVPACSDAGELDAAQS